MAALTENIINKILTEERFYYALKLEQLKVIECIVKKRDTFGVLPTDFGKNMLYHSCALHLSIMHLKNIINP